MLAREKAEAISAVLYPNDSTPEGKELRLKQQYFFVAASLQVRGGRCRWGPGLQGHAGRLGWGWWWFGGVAEAELLGWHKRTSAGLKSSYVHAPSVSSACASNAQTLYISHTSHTTSMAISPPQDVMSRFKAVHGTKWELLPEKACFQLNDTHPTIAVAELTRLLVDVEGLAWDQVGACFLFLYRCVYVSLLLV